MNHEKKVLIRELIFELKLPEPAKLSPHRLDLQKKKNRWKLVNLIYKAIFYLIKNDFQIKTIVILIALAMFFQVKQYVFENAKKPGSLRYYIFESKWIFYSNFNTTF